MKIAKLPLQSAEDRSAGNLRHQFSILDIDLPEQVAVVEPDTAAWAIVRRGALFKYLAGGNALKLKARSREFQREMDKLRFGLKPSAVYFNPTERCNFDCSYCYLPQAMRRRGKTMSAQELCAMLERLLAYFRGILPAHVKPQVIFHGSEPMLAREAVFAGIRKFHKDFHFGVQTNATLLDEKAIDFLTEHRVGIGISLDGPTAKIADDSRKDWRGKGAFAHVIKVLKRLASYPAFNVIATVTRRNVHALVEMVNFYHNLGVGVVMFNPVRCTRPGGRKLKPDDAVLAKSFCAALDRTFDLYQQTGQKLVVANFANVLAGIAGPTTRRLMCDISPCGGGRCFFAVSARGDIFPCSEFIGLDKFKGGNIYRDPLSAVLDSAPFKEITQRKTEDFSPCSSCIIRHFCGAPCPAEIKAVTGTVHAASPYCEFYQDQVRCAFRVIAQDRLEAYLWDDWKKESIEK